MKPGFLDLEQKNHLSSQELVSTFQEYAEEGSAIIGHVVISLIRRVGLTSPERIRMIRYAATAIRIHKDRLHFKEAKEYQMVRDHLMNH